MSALRPEISLRIAVSALLIFLTASCNNWSDAQVEETKRRGDIVRNALQQYRDRTGAFPDELTQLIPAYLREIPQPTVGKKSWDYWIVKGGSFYRIGVAIASQSEPDLQADSDSTSWLFDTK